MQYPVPQFIDIEDTVVGPLTIRQSGYLGVAGVVGFISTLLLAPLYAAIVSIPVVIAAIALAFYKPHGRPLIVHIRNFFVFGSKPKLYVWRRDPEGILVKRSIKKESIKDGLKAEYKIVSRNRLHELAWMLDTRQAMDVEGEEERG